jgi:SAM-dependent methyltransferase
MRRPIIEFVRRLVGQNHVMARLDALATQQCRMDCLLKQLQAVASQSAGTSCEERADPPCAEPEAQPPPVTTAPFRAELLQQDERIASFTGNGLKISFTPQEQYPFTIIRIENAREEIFEDKLHYSHLGLGRFLTGFDFNTVLEIGSRNGVVARAMAFAGKNVTTCEILDTYDASFSGDYLDLKVNNPFDAIWCSHVLEHQRYLGRFLDKMFDDLKDGGVLAVTVPAALSPLLQGHVNIFTPGLLLYNLICAGFDCTDAQVKTYDWQFSLIVRKRPNGVPRTSFGSERLLGNQLGGVPQLNSLFPEPFRSGFSADGVAWGEVERVNW